MFLFGKKKAPTQANATQPLNHIHVTQASLGIAVPFVRGQRRLPPFLLWAPSSGFQAIPHTHTTTTGGGKGLGGGGKQTNTTINYTYQQALIAGLCLGPIDGIVNVWDTKGRFAQASATENFTIPGGGGSYQVVNHDNFGTDSGVGHSQAYSQLVDDFGGNGPTTLSGSFLMPFDPVPGSPGGGQYGLAPATGTYSFSGADAGKTVSITYTYNLANVEQQTITAIPGTPYQVTVVSTPADFLQDLGVVFDPSGNALQLITGTPSAGQYAYLGSGVYQFAAADVGQQIVITFLAKNSLGQDASQALTFTLLTGATGQTPWGFLTASYPGEDIGYTQLAYIASDIFQLGTNAEIPNYNYEVLVSPDSHGAGIVDCNPVDVITTLLTDPVAGIPNFPASFLGDWTDVQAFWAANSFFISPLINNHTSAASEIGSYLEAGQAGGFWSEGLFKIVPLGDTSAAGNGFIYIAPTAPVTDLSDDDFLEASGKDPIKVMRTPPQDSYNKVQLEWSNRLASYNKEITIEQDDATISVFGSRVESPVSYSFITTLPAAQFAANLRLKRNVYIRNSYEFKLASRWFFLEPLDLVTITIPGLGYDHLPVRIKKVVIQPIGQGVEIVAEEFPWGTAQPTLYPKQLNTTDTPQAGMADPGSAQIIAFESPDRFGLQQGNVLNIAVTSATNNSNFGGAHLWISFDGTAYVPAPTFTVNAPARIGSLAQVLPTGTVDPDTQTLTVNMKKSAALASVSATDFAQNTALCAVLNTSAAVPVNLSGAFNVQGIYTDGGTFGIGAGIDSGGFAYSATLLGTTQQPDAFVYNIGATGANNVVSNATITLPNQKFQAIQILATAVNGNQLAQTFTVTYQDLTTDVFTRDMSDWVFPQNFGGETTAFHMNYRNVHDGTRDFVHPVFIYEYIFQVNPNKAVKNVILPANANVSCLAATGTTPALELLSYENAVLSDKNQFQLTPLHRGLFGTANVGHLAGETLVRIDSAVLQEQFDPSYNGKTLYLKATAFNTLGGREQGLDQVSAYVLALKGVGPGGLDPNLGIVNQGKGSVPNSWSGAIAYTFTDTTITVTYDIIVNRPTAPKPYQKSSHLEYTHYKGTLTITGLTASTLYYLYPYIDDAVPGGAFTLASIGGAAGTPPVAYPVQSDQATFMQGRNDHIPLSKAPVAVTTAALGGSGGGSGGGTGGSCPRGDMVVYRKTGIEKEIVAAAALRAGEYILSPAGWVKVRKTIHKLRNTWLDIDTTSEGCVVTPRHLWPLDSGEKRSCELTFEDVLLCDTGRAFLTSLRVIKEEALCVSIEVESADQCYYIGKKIPKLVAHNLQPDES